MRNTSAALTVDYDEPSAIRTLLLHCKFPSENPRSIEYKEDLNGLAAVVDDNGSYSFAPRAAISDNFTAIVTRDAEPPASLSRDDNVVVIEFLCNIESDDNSSDNELSSDDCPGGCASAISTEDECIIAEQYRAGEAAVNVCGVCDKPAWQYFMKPAQHDRHPYCCQTNLQNQPHYDYTTDLNDAPALPRSSGASDTTAYVVAKDMSRHRAARRRQRDAFNPNVAAQELDEKVSRTMEEHPAYLLPAITEHGPPTAHREKERVAGDLSDHLINWYSLVAKPVPRNEWKDNPGATAVVETEWAKFRAADNNHGTWDESAVQEHYVVQKEAKEKLEQTGIHTHFGRFFDLYVVTPSELDESTHKYKGRVVFGGHRVFDGFGLAAEFPDQGCGASFLTA